MEYLIVAGKFEEATASEIHVPLWITGPSKT